MAATAAAKRSTNARSTHSQLKEADLQMECFLNGGNLRYTVLSSEATPTAVVAE
jgi:hypothetical protein